ncbi:MAG: ABC transporter substrate-binding protein [Candidatus Eisenbacteria bacterium]|nr:ABC transporter substrate-binding protein [Candidatus Eisenbacteria bacterium]
MTRIARPIVAVVLALACLCIAGASGCSRPAPPLRIAVTPWPGYEYVVLARDLGFFAAEGVDVQVVELESPGDARSAFENGLVDVNAATLVELLVTRAQTGRRPQAFYVLDYSDGGDMLVADSSIATIADLRGQRVAVEAASVDLLALALALESAGMTLADVELAVMPQSEKPGEMRNHSVRAAQCFPPASSEIEALPGTHRLFDSSRAPGMIVDVLVADSAAIAREPRRFMAVVRAVDRAQKWAGEHETEAIAAMAKREQITPEQFRTALAGVELVPLARQRAHLAPGGSAERAISSANRALTQAGTLKSVPAGAQLVTTLAVPAEGAR